MSQSRPGHRKGVIHSGIEVADTAELESLTGDLIEIIGHAAALLAAGGARLSSGDVVIAGSVIPPLKIRPGDNVVYELAPLAAVSVQV